MSIQVNITSTTREYGRDKKYYRNNHETLHFATMRDAHDYLIGRYGNCKRIPMYRDGKDGKPIRCGVIYAFHNSDAVQKWLQQDWVSFAEVKPLDDWAAKG